MKHVPATGREGFTERGIWAEDDSERGKLGGGGGQETGMKADA